MKVSIIVLIYNMETLLPKCLESLENQTLTDLEFVLVDDGSTDSSSKICDNWQPKIGKKVVIHKENGGVTAGWLDGVKMATGEYVGFVDSDDFIENNMYFELYSKASKYNLDVAMCDHNYIVNGNIRPCGQIIEEGLYEGEKLDSIRPKIFPKIADRYLSPSLCNKIFKKEVFLKNTKYADPFVTVADDVSVVVPTFLGIKSFYYVNKPMYNYVVRQGSTTYKYKETLYEQYKLLIKNLKRAISDYNYDVKNELDDAISHFGMQWLSMVTKSNLPKKEKAKVYQILCNDVEFKESIENIIKTKNNKWAKAYYSYFKNKNANFYKFLLFLMKIKERLKI